MRLLLINPNTTQAVTDRILAVAQEHAAPDTELVGVTGRFGAAYVASRSSYAIAGHAALDAWAKADDGTFDAVVLSCFGDPGLDALREICSVPVLGMAESSMHLAAELGQRFGIVTGGERWGPMLREFAASRGLGGQLATVETVAPTGGDIARDPEGSLKLLSDACNAAAKAGADHVILAGAGLAGLVPRIQDSVPVPLIDSVVAVIQMAERIAAAGRPATNGASAAASPIASIGLSPELAIRLPQ
jgi:allantoin racemase